MDEPTDKLRRKEPCPLCGGHWIDAKVEIIQMYDNGIDKYSAWCFCRNCGHRGMGIKGRFSNKSDALDQAYIMWNKEK